mgnify:CR=1 FL=1
MVFRKTRKKTARSIASAMTGTKFLTAKITINTRENQHGKENNLHQRENHGR